jgi:CRP/FNR family transcriptional regulator, anaerobic regulatory protein
VSGIAPLAPVISIHDPKIRCHTCSMRDLCLPAAFTGDQMNQFDALVAHRTKVMKGESLYRAGEPFHALYAIRSGSVKTTVLGEDGREQVTGYHMLGEVIGFDGLGGDTHCAGAIALEDTEVCSLPFAKIEKLARTMPALQRNLHRMMAREITRDHSMMLMLASMHAEERLAVFLLNLADRYLRRGYSSSEYVLRMTRQEIGSYLGLKLETVSRAFSRFHGDGLIQVQGRALKLLDSAALKRIASPPD